MPPVGRAMGVRFGYPPPLRPVVVLKPCPSRFFLTRGSGDRLLDLDELLDGDSDGNGISGGRLLVGLLDDLSGGGSGGNAIAGDGLLDVSPRPSYDSRLTSGSPIGLCSLVPLDLICLNGPVWYGADAGERVH